MGVTGEWALILSFQLEFDDVCRRRMEPLDKEQKNTHETCFENVILCWTDSVCRTQAWDSSMISRGEAELTSLPVHVALEGRELWDKFSNIGTEMLITKTGR